ncbi:UDP-glucose 4-epimerase [Chytriomyces confervae]|uniref:UDP-glucose 4-epimerase n=1 Tax=Chytriomyces confervae TaxID=246404 RepID=A0A507DWX1_9FUNG|nr:UDP-glucose 4-epimerase [Chytriomyces confervae]
MSRTKVVVAGGAGYIGSHVVRQLQRTGRYDIVVLDNLSTGHKESIPAGVAFEKGDIRDAAFLDATFAKYKPEAVFVELFIFGVGDSVKDPLSYYENNVSGTITLLQALVKHDVKYFVFSSTAAVFGYPENDLVRETDAKDPINPYGDTKLVVEVLLKWVEQAHKIKYVCLRYFNACGADESGEIGEDLMDETHLIPLILQVPLGKREHIYIFGDDYKTHDGTCIRDYVHVSDIADAHIYAVEHLTKTGKSDNFNLGSGKGYSVKEIVEAARAVTGHAIPAQVKDRRGGDPDSLVASSEKAETVLGWKRKYATINDIVASAWKWHTTHPQGYRTPK